MGKEECVWRESKRGLQNTQQALLVVLVNPSVSVWQYASVQDDSQGWNCISMSMGHFYSQLEMNCDNGVFMTLPRLQTSVNDSLNAVVTAWSIHNNIITTTLISSGMRAQSIKTAAFLKDNSMLWF